MRGDLRRRLVQWLRLWRANSSGGKPDCDVDAGRPLPVALHAMNCVCSERVVRHCIAPLPHPTPARRCAPCKRWYQTPTSASWRPPPLGQNGGARFGQALVSGQRLHHAQAPWRATRTLLRVRARHSLEKPGCVLQRLRARCGHPQRRARACQSFALASACQHPVVANALDSRGQDVLHEPAHELFARKPHGALATIAVGPSRELCAELRLLDWGRVRPPSNSRKIRA